MTWWGRSSPITPAPWQELLRVKRKNVRTNTVSVEADPPLYKLGNASAKLWNEINYEKRQAFNGHIVAAAIVDPEAIGIITIKSKTIGSKALGDTAIGSHKRNFKVSSNPSNVVLIWKEEHCRRSFCFGYK